MDVTLRKIGLACIPIALAIVVWASLAGSSSRALQVVGTDPVVMTAGDIACAPGDIYYQAGEGDATHCHQKKTSDLLIVGAPNVIIPLGDTQYLSGELTNYQQSYASSWERDELMLKTHPVPGNHEYRTPGAAGYFEYFGARAGDPIKGGYYSFELGNWHLIALNTNCKTIPKGVANSGCAQGSPQNVWLEGDLAANSKPCILAYSIMQDGHLARTMGDRRLGSPSSKTCIATRPMFSWPVTIMFTSVSRNRVPAARSIP